MISAPGPMPIASPPLTLLGPTRAVGNASFFEGVGHLAADWQRSGVGASCGGAHLCTVIFPVAEVAVCGIARRP